MDKENLRKRCSYKVWIMTNVLNFLHSKNLRTEKKEEQSSERNFSLSKLGNKKSLNSIVNRPMRQEEKKRAL